MYKHVYLKYSSSVSFFFIKRLKIQIELGEGYILSEEDMNSQIIFLQLLVILIYKIHIFIVIL